MFEGDLEKGELEIGQVAAIINEILPVETIMKNLVFEYQAAKERMNSDQFEF
jgi:enoyl-[acyl-carrier protein] reductase II